VRRLRRSSPPVASFAFSRLGVPDSSAASPVMVDSTLAPAPAYAWMVLLPPRPEDRRSLDRQALPKLRCDRTSDAAEVDVTGRVFRASCLVRLARSHFTYGGFSPRGRKRLASRHHPPPGPLPRGIGRFGGIGGAFPRFATNVPVPLVTLHRARPITSLYGDANDERFCRRPHRHRPVDECGLPLPWIQ
jgi:hypothetical protein